MIQGLDHVAIIVSSEKSISFYEKLGFSIIERIKRNYDEVVFMEIMGLILEIFVDDKHPRRLNQPEATGLRHLALRTDNITQTIAKLKKDGIEAEPIRQDWHGLNFTFVKDSDGLPIEIKERGNI